MNETSVYDFEVRTLEGVVKSIRDYAGQVLLIVNVASKCGFTPQYRGLEQLYLRYKDCGFHVLGFPCNQFGGQEPGNEAEIGKFCTEQYGVSFPMFAKIEVNGKGAHPLYRFLTQERKGLLGTENIKWNFSKFLVNRQGRVIDRFASTTTPEALAEPIEKALSQA